MTGSTKRSLHSHARLHTMPAEEEERLAKLFDKLDVNKDGKIDVEDLSKGLYAMGIPTVAGQAEASKEMCHTVTDCTNLLIG